MVLPNIDKISPVDLNGFHPGWLAVALAIHLVMSLSLGALFGLLLPRFRPIPSTRAWGGLLMPLLWTSVSYGLMGVVHPLLQQRVDWVWFIASQFVFGVVEATVVHRSERVDTPARGRRPGCPETRCRWSGWGCFVIIRRFSTSACLILAATLAVGCSKSTEPMKDGRPVRSDQVVDFTTLYGQHCAGCHGADGQFGPAPPINDPLFLAIVPDSVLLDLVTDGRPGTPMPAFSRPKGGR